MSKVIVYQRNEGSAAIFWPADHAYESHTMEEIGAIAVPTGLPFKIVDSAEIPTDRSERNAWVVNEQELTDGVGL
ncbi:hypothetical protein [Neorhizobium sp. T25_27]|uniref:hypothetical protein n=1 Tax=Neorhizobium sp. T25_27 TaxID=2093831 RepID=UPI000CF8EBC8|nr:hypothetical protein [Neorhizobium sp. T25_27]